MAEGDTIAEGASDELRSRILNAAAALIRANGTAAATTRAVAMAASVQAPTIYRLFGDKDGLLNAVAERELSAYVAGKKGRKPHPDPVVALRQGWDTHVAFGLANPALFWIMSSNPQSPAAEAGLRILTQRIHAIALAGRLRTTEERAAAMIHAACLGTVLTLLGHGGQKDDLGLSEATRDAVISVCTNDVASATAGGVRSAATTLRAMLGQTNSLTKGERALLDELLFRLGKD